MVKKQNKYAVLFEKYWAAIALALFIILFVVLYTVFARLSVIEYEGLTFVKEKYQDLQVYRYSYYFNEDGQTYKNNIYLRIDPRENEIPVYGEVSYTGEIVYIGINSTNVSYCEDSQIALAGLAQFLANNQLRVRVGTLSPEDAIERNQTLVSCEAYPGSTVVKLEYGESADVTRLAKRCYQLQVNSCEDLLPVTEKFITQSVIDAKSAQNN